MRLHMQGPDKQHDLKSAIIMKRFGILDSNFRIGKRSLKGAPKNEDFTFHKCGF
ncbi:hypothetical protein J6590_101922, partial [Homalodisca vitripennis]